MSAGAGLYFHGDVTMPKTGIVRHPKHGMPHSPSHFSHLVVANPPPDSAEVVLGGLHLLFKYIIKWRSSEKVISLLVRQWAEWEIGQREVALSELPIEAATTRPVLTVHRRTRPRAQPPGRSSPSEPPLRPPRRQPSRRCPRPRTPRLLPADTHPAPPPA